MSNHDEKANKRLGEVFKKSREKMNLTQADVAGKTDITVNYYAMIERGEVNPSISKVRKILSVLKISSSKIF